MTETEDEKNDDFLAPLKYPTKYFEGQDNLVRLLRSFGLNEKNVVTTVHLVARAIEKASPRPITSL